MENYKDKKMDEYMAGEVPKWTFERWKYGWRSVKEGKMDGYMYGTGWKSTKMGIQKMKAPTVG